MDSYQYDFWQCGHITSIATGIRVSEYGNLTVPSLSNIDRSAIQRQPNGLCARCHADYLKKRLQDVRSLLLACTFRAVEAELDARKLDAVKNFLFYDTQERFRISLSQWTQYPAAFLRTEAHILQLELEACEAVISDYAAGHSRRLRANTAQIFIDRITQIGKEAAQRAKSANEGMSECLLDIMTEAKKLIDEFQMAQEKEAVYLKELEVKATHLRILLEGYDPKIGERYKGESEKKNVVLAIVYK
ncbi:hypothetical protein F5B22DRAFT_649503 [Xylaria bambusicola]|uniref:uncharacterized protein n=1 Tax=Xylaria bambusicola TaxID=326684 RepID=UPI002008152E|nr:uncharacterized protein F5B22DRAFT_649503 [Xylaria bambusicola]KAI0509004.1 hypothetical protein F5B22DRAFT_649503 [Xylaria bambusicola]